jgi:putative transposase
MFDSPVPRPRDWLEVVRRPQSEAEVAALRHSVIRGTPFGSAHWTADTAGNGELGDVNAFHRFI